MAEQSFQALEQAGWVAKAGEYDELFATITDQAIDPILGSFGAIDSKRVLDVACGTGHIAGVAAERGALSEGIDFASTMVAKAKGRYPKVSFREGDAEQLPYDDSSCDAVACGFGLLHMANPERVIKEAWRVLRSGGRYTFTVWCSPDQGGEFFNLVMGAVQMHGTLDVPLPPAPPVFRFADPGECTKVLMSAGFVDPKVLVLPLTWRAARPEDVLNIIYKGAVRTSMLLEAQTVQAREAIHQAILKGSEAFRKGNAIEFGFPASMATAAKG
ncbi:MAG: methyltransferase domain-containing protein [Burkholderiales bacterium]|nr:methyltransferase domain-containing protein [Burkholderiales bacterium]